MDHPTSDGESPGPPPGPGTRRPAWRALSVATTLVIAVAAAAIVALAGQQPPTAVSLHAAGAPSPSVTPAAATAPHLGGPTVLTYSGALNGVLLHPRVTCNAPTRPSSQDTMVVQATLNGQPRVLVITSYLGEPFPIGVSEGPPPPGVTATPAPLVYAPAAGPATRLTQGWDGSPSPIAFLEKGPLPEQPTTSSIPALSWTTGATLNINLYAFTPATGTVNTSRRLHVSGIISCPGDTGRAPGPVPPSTSTRVTPMPSITPLATTGAAPTPAPSAAAPASAQPSTDPTLTPSASPPV